MPADERSAFLDDIVHRAGSQLPTFALRRLLTTAFDGFACSLSIHRVVAQHRPVEWQHGMNIPADELDVLIDLLLGSRAGLRRGWLTVTFDDGYADAVKYVRDRAPRFPDVQFICFVCPEKIERHAGFRWDLAEEAMRVGIPGRVARVLCDAPVDAGHENARHELHRVGGLPAYRLASVDELRAIAHLPNVALGNQTNLHLDAAACPDTLVMHDYRQSHEDFTRLFGGPRHFAFPYGKPGEHFGERHVRALRAVCRCVLWTTEARPFRPSERAPGSLVPRFAFEGEHNAHDVAFWMIAHALSFRAHGGTQRV